jgi:hypothetical protein
VVTWWGADGDEERPAEQTVVDGAQLDAAFRLALPELGGVEQRGERVVVALELLDPRSGHGGELCAAVGLVDVDEAGSLEELTLAQVGGDGHGTVAMRAAALPGIEPGRRMDREVGDAPARPEELSGRSQHGELGP